MYVKHSDPLKSNTSFPLSVICLSIPTLQITSCAAASCQTEMKWSQAAIKYFKYRLLFQLQKLHFNDCLINICPLQEKQGGFFLFEFY